MAAAVAAAGSVVNLCSNIFCFWRRNVFQLRRGVGTTADRRPVGIGASTCDSSGVTAPVVISHYLGG